MRKDHLGRAVAATLVAAAWAVAGGDSSQRGVSLAASPAYRLGPGDVLDITIFEVEELSKPAVMAPDGTVRLPLVGTVELAGLTPTEAAERLRRLYANNLIRDPQIAVSVKEYNSQPVAVLGAVARPGVYQLRGPRRLTDVLALAEGLTPEAGSEILISRPEAPRGDAGGPGGPGAGGAERTLSVATSALISLSGRPEDNPWVQAHDTIRVSRAGVVYVVGEVGRAGGFPLKDREQITVLKALSLAEGLKRTASPQKARIIRQRAGSRQETPVRVNDILGGRAPDPPLGPDDILFVPHSQAKTALGRTAEAAVQIATGVIIWRR